MEDLIEYFIELSYDQKTEMASFVKNDNDFYKKDPKFELHLQNNQCEGNDIIFLTPKQLNELKYAKFYNEDTILILNIQQVACCVGYNHYILLDPVYNINDKEIKSYYFHEHEGDSYPIH